MGKQKQEEENLAAVVVTVIVQPTRAILDSRYVTSVVSWTTLHECVEATKLQLYSSQIELGKWWTEEGPCPVIGAVLDESIFETT